MLQAIVWRAPVYALQGVDTLNTTSVLTPDTSGNYSTAGRGRLFPTNETFNLQFNTNTGNLILNGFSIGATTFSRSSQADRIFVRREGNANSSSIRLRYFAEADLMGNDLNIFPARPTSIEALVLGNIINRGVLDMFLNVNQGGERANNIERLDVVFTTGIVAPAAAELDQAGFIQMEKSGNNPFQIAAITAIDAMGNPTAYGNLVSVQPANYAQTTINTNNTWLENDAMDNPAGSGDHGLPGPYFRQPETLGAVFISLLDLGINAGQTLFGFSMMGEDVVPGTHNLLDPSTFPQDTGGGNQGGNGADFYGGGGGYFVASSLQTPRLGVAKQAAVTGNNVALALRIENFGNVTLNNLSLIDDLDTTFGAGNYTVGIVSVTTPPATSTVTLNPGYTGAAGATAELLDTANSALAMGEFAILDVPITVTNVADQGNGVGVFFNTAVGAGNPPSGAANRVRDDSTDGPDPDADGNNTDGSTDGDGVPDENTPTPITVGQNLPPVAADDSATTPLDTPVTLAVIANDSDPDGAINPATVDLDPNTPGRQTTLSVPDQGAFNTDDEGNVTFIPVTGFIGRSTIPYTVQDDQGAVSNPATITVMVIGSPNQPPVAMDDNVTTPLNTPVIVDIIANDSDPDGAINPATVDLDPNTPGRQTTRNVPDQGAFNAADDGTVTFIPETGFTGVATISYTVQDNQDNVSNPANITVTVTGAPNQPPVATDDSITTPFNTTVIVDIIANDSDPDGNIDPATVDLDPNAPGRQTTMGVPGQGNFSAGDDGTVTFIPETGFTGVATIPYTVQDNQGNVSNPANIIVTVIGPANQPPVAASDSAFTPLDTPVTLMVTANDSDPDGTIDPATVDLDPNAPGRQTTRNVPDQGNFNAEDDGNVTFTPEAGFIGVATIPYTVQDDQGNLSNPADITVQVISPEGNQPPLAVSDHATTPQDMPVTLAVTANDRDFDGMVNPATVDLDPSTPGRQTMLNVPEQGIFTADDRGNVTFSPAPGFTGISSIPYTVQDNQDTLSNPANITVTVTGPDGNRPPVAIDDHATTPVDTPVTIAITTNDRDPDGDINPATVDLDPSTPGRQALLTITEQGTFAADDAGRVRFAPADGFTGISSIPYTVRDNQGSLSNLASITVTVFSPGNQPPTAVDDRATTSPGTPVTIPVTANDSDPDGDINPATVDLAPNTPGRQTTRVVPEQGTFTADNAGTVIFTPVSGFTGTATISYTVQDNQGTASNPATITVVVERVPNVFDPPSGLKFVNPADLPELEWRVVWMNNGNVADNAVQVTDDTPANTIFVAGSLTCEARGSSTVDRCEFEAQANRVVYEGTIAADLGARTEEEAANEVVMTYRATVPLGFFGPVANQAQANWDADGNGTLENELASRQQPVVTDDVTTALPLDATLVDIPPAPGACLFQVRQVVEADEADKDDNAETIADPDEGALGQQVTLTGSALTTPQLSQVVAGSSVAVAAIQGPPSEGTTVFPLVRVTVANTDVDVMPDIIEETGLKTQEVTARQDQVVVTASGVLVALPTAALTSDETLDIVEVDAAIAPVPLPGETAAGLWRLETVSGLTQFASPLTLRLPYSDADQNGLVDGTFPGLSETELTLWFFDVTQGWRQLASAVVIPDVNVIVAETDQTGIFGIFRASDGSLGIVGNASDDINLRPSSPALPESANTGHFRDIGLDITTPFVAGWDTAQLRDGDYELRAVCTATPIDLTEFQTTSGSGSNLCFIATAAYGTPWMPQVRALRRFRDTHLLTHAPGRWFVEQYYRLSPPLADRIRDRAGLRAMVRIGLTPVVWTVQVIMLLAGSPLLTLTGLGVAGGAGVGWRLYGRRRHTSKIKNVGS